MGIFGKKPDTSRKLVIGPMSDNEIDTAHRITGEFVAAVGNDAAMRKVSRDIYAAAGVRRVEDLLTTPDASQAPWQWLAAVASYAAERKRSPLVGQIFAFMTVWNRSVAPLLDRADWVDLVLVGTPWNLELQITTIALPCLVELPKDQVIAGNSTGQVTAGDLASFAAVTVSKLDEGDPACSPELLRLASRVLNPDPTPASMRGGSLLAPAVQQLDRIKKALADLDLTFVDLGEAVVGVGVGLIWDESDWVVVSVSAGGLENVVSITAAILKDVVQDRLKVLDTCNSLTRGNPTYPVFLHDAQQGWDILVQQQLHIELALANPSFLHLSLQNLPIYAKKTREQLANVEMGGDPYIWGEEDAHRLLIRSMM